YRLRVVGGLLAEPEVRDRPTYGPSPSLYPAAGRRRYVRSRPGADEQRHLLVSVRDSEALVRALEAAAAGVTPAELTARFAATGTDPERARRFVDNLVEQQVLVPDLDVQVTGADATYGLAEAAPALAGAREELAALDAEPLGVPPDRYRRIAAGLEPLPAPVTLDRLFQVDLTKASPQATLGREVVDEILHGVDLLRRIGGTNEDVA